MDGLSFLTVINPFDQQLKFQISSTQNEKVNIFLFDAQGRVVRSKSVLLTPGTNQVSFDNTSVLSTGIYILTIESPEGRLQKKVAKQVQ